MTIGCTDCADLPKVPEAGRIVPGPDGDVQIMHNGLKVVAGGYHGDWMAHIIRSLRGHHEPQEERLFSEVLRLVRHRTVMVELGCFWAYYTLWFLSEIPGSRALCIEPDPAFIAVGRRNAALNGLTARMTFDEAWAGGQAAPALTQAIESAPEPRTLPCRDMPTVMAMTGAEQIELLHMDIQGHELGFLKSMRAATAAGQVRFLFASTHHETISGSPTTHVDCAAEIVAQGGTVLCEHSVEQSFSGDGLILASFMPHDRDLAMPPISRNTRARSLFPH